MLLYVRVPGVMALYVEAFFQHVGIGVHDSAVCIQNVGIASLDQSGLSDHQDCHILQMPCQAYHTICSKLGDLEML